MATVGIRGCVAAAARNRPEQCHNSEKVLLTAMRRDKQGSSLNCSVSSMLFLVKLACLTHRCPKKQERDHHASEHTSQPRHAAGYRCELPQWIQQQPGWTPPRCSPWKRWQCWPLGSAWTRCRLQQESRVTQSGIFSHH